MQGFTTETQSTQSAQGTPPANGPCRPARAARRRSPLAGDLAGMPADQTQAPHLSQEKGTSLKECKDSPQRRRVRRAPKAPHPQTELDDPQEPHDVGARLRATWQGCQRNRQWQISSRAGCSVSASSRCRLARRCLHSGLGRGLAVCSGGFPSGGRKRDSNTSSGVRGLGSML